jgi:hypothetical protein
MAKIGNELKKHFLQEQELKLDLMLKSSFKN